MKRYNQSLTLTGLVIEEPKQGASSFRLQCRSGDIFEVFAGNTTSFEVLTNLDGLDNDRYPPLPKSGGLSAAENIAKYIRKDRLVSVEGIYQQDDTAHRYDARTVHLVTSPENEFLFERPHWWLTQVTRLANQWLDSLFGDRRNYGLEDFVALYRTNLNITGLATDDETQECAVLSRLIYGFSAAFMLTGDERYRTAAAAGVRFQREAFRTLSHDGQYCIWAYGRQRTRFGTKLLVPSQSGDDRGSIALYEQIYALAGLTHYYRLSLDWEVLQDIRCTVNAFKMYFYDQARDNDTAYKGQGGWFSHIDYATMRPDKNLNVDNNCKKNWNSVGDHIPAYLINLILTLEPQVKAGRTDLQEFYDQCRDMLDEATGLILDKFPGIEEVIVDGKTRPCPFVNERFLADWTPDHNYGWQQNRAIIGHNFKIAWNLTRVANYYDTIVAQARLNGEQQIALKYQALATKCMELADRLGQDMTRFGIDQLRGGCFDALERDWKNGQPVEFSWMNTKDFWQQEQAILAYLIMHGYKANPLYLDMARETASFWNLYFLDHDNRGMFFRVTENGLPIAEGVYGVRGGHSDASGYHCFELNYLAHIYTRAYVASEFSEFCLHFKPAANSGATALNLLPDFMPPGRLRIKRVSIDGSPMPSFDKYRFQIELTPEDLGRDVLVVIERIPESVDGGRPILPVDVGPVVFSKVIV